MVLYALIVLMVIIKILLILNVFKHVVLAHMLMTILNLKCAHIVAETVISVPMQLIVMFVKMNIIYKIMELVLKIALEPFMKMKKLGLVQGV